MAEPERDAGAADAATKQFMAAEWRDIWGLVRLLPSVGQVPRARRREICRNVSQDASDCSQARNVTDPNWRMTAKGDTASRMFHGTPSTPPVNYQTTTA